jgi:hypothetical protein
MKINKKMKVYIFFRADMWYPIELKDDADAIANAAYNAGTTKVEDSSGKVIWELPKN